MKPKHEKSLVWRVGIGLILTESIVALLIGAFIYSNLKAFHYERTEDLLRGVCHAISSVYADPLRSNEQEQLQNLVAQESSDSGLRVSVLSPLGEVVGDSHRDVSTMDNHAQRSEVADAISGGEGSSVRRSETLGEDAMYFAQRIGTPPNVLGVVRVATSIDNVNTQLNSVVQTVVIGGLLWIAVTIGSIVFFSTKLSMAIGRLSTEASRLAINDPGSGKLESPGREFTPLVDSLNEMVSLLRDRMDDIRSNQREQVTILRSMESGVIAIDRDRRVLRLNPAAQRMLQLPEAHARGKTLAEIAPRSRLAAHVSDAFQTGRITTEEIEFDDPGRFIVRAASSVLREPDGEAVGLLIMLTDITRIRRLESMRSDFAANVSHELRTPITNIQGFAETLLSMPPETTEEHHEFLEIISRNAIRLGSIVEDLLTLSRLEREESQAALEKVPTPIARVIDTVIEVLAPRATAENVTFQTDLEPALIGVINQHLVEQAITNLLTNAIRHSPDGGTITISAHSSTLDAETPAIEIGVADEGRGIPEEHLSRLFERFFRLDQSRGRAAGGTGLGLAIVKHIVLVHGGTVGVESEVGKGTCFRIILPAR